MDWVRQLLQPSLKDKTGVETRMSAKTLIEIGLVLPVIPDARDACVLRLTELLTAKE